MALGALVVHLGLDAADFVSNLSKSEAQAKRFAQSIDRDMVGATKALGIVAGGFATLAGAGVLLLKSQADQIDRLNDAADATGASIEKVSALEDTARRNGESLDTATGILVKFNSTLKDFDPNSKAAKIIEKLGLDAEALKKQDPAEALKQTARAFTAFADDGSKARNIQELFGKSIRDAGPFLKDLSEQTELVGSQTEESAREAEKFGKHLSDLATFAGDAGRASANTLIPPINRLFDETKSKGFASALGVDGFDTKVQQLVSGYKLIGLAAERARVESIVNLGPDKTDQRNIDEARRRLQEIDAEGRRLADTFNGARQAMLGIGTSAAGAGRGFVNPPLPLPTMGDPDPKPKKDSLTEGERYAESLRQQAQRTEDLTKSEEVLREVREGRLKGEGAAVRDAAKGYAIEIDASKALDDTFKDASASSADWVRKQLDGIDASKRAVEELLGHNDALRDEIAIITGGEEARRAIERARLDAAISTKEMTLSQRELNGASVTEIANLEREIELLRERAGLLVARDNATDGTKKLNDQLRESERIVSSFRNSFADAYADFITGTSSAKDAFKSFATDVISNLARIQAEQAAMTLFGTPAQGSTPGTQGVFGGFISGLFGGVGHYNQGKFVGPPEHAAGLEYVPYDGYIASLHRGERVQTAAEARNGRNSGGMKVNVYNNNGSRVETRLNGDDLDIFIDAVANDVRRGGRMANAVKGINSRPWIQR